MSVFDWSLTPGENTPPEGVLPGQINDEMRINKSVIREAFNDLPWVPYGDGSGTAAWEYVSSSSIRIAADVTTRHHVGVRCRITGSTTGTVYASISSSSYSGGFTTLGFGDMSGNILADSNLTVSIGAPAANSTIPYATTSLRGIAELATAAECAAGTDMLRVMAPGLFASGWDVGANGHVTFPAQFLVQWGQAGDNEVVTFEVAFNSIYGVLTSPQIDVAAHRISYPSVISTTGFTMRVRDTAGNTTGFDAFWVALGKASA